MDTADNASTSISHPPWASSTFLGALKVKIRGSMLRIHSKTKIDNACLCIRLRLTTRAHKRVRAFLQHDKKALNAMRECFSFPLQMLLTPRKVEKEERVERSSRRDFLPAMMTHCSAILPK